jgi:hypothetical protein
MRQRQRLEIKGIPDRPKEERAKVDNPNGKPVEVTEGIPVEVAEAGLGIDRVYHVPLGPPSRSFYSYSKF